jgi:hypothetical protein
MSHEERGLVTELLAFPTVHSLSKCVFMVQDEKKKTIGNVNVRKQTYMNMNIKALFVLHCVLRITF